MRVPFFESGAATGRKFAFQSREDQREPRSTDFAFGVTVRQQQLPAVPKPRVVSRTSRRQDRKSPCFTEHLWSSLRPPRRMFHVKHREPGWRFKLLRQHSALC